MKTALCIIGGGLVLSVVLPLLASVPTTIPAVYQLSYLITWMFG